ncbi:hypothetical protein AK830_g8908 [Neonectria ditissima]|uniref:Peptidase S8/S53 domain-containing protein n=1 Tax=Neonectria ditissima TaxID=78410 RepID=A0A0P7BB90_9HYPO|nr:hypothetical protein AK830_g8908 [Neonectria ditissima]
MRLLIPFLFSPYVLGALLPRAEAPCPYHRPNAKLIEDEYIVVLHRGHTLQKHFDQIGSDLTVNASMFYSIDTINGYRAKLPQDFVHDHIRFDPGVEFVEHDHSISLIEPIFEGEDDSAYEDSTEAQPGFFRGLLNRLHNFRRDNWWHWQISHRDGAWYDAMKSFGKKHNPMWWWTKQSWQVLDGAGKGVNLYVIDTGVRLSHSNFQGRAINFHLENTSPYVGGATADDKHGHGTHVAGTAAGARGGMAPWATIVNVKVMCQHDEPNCRGDSGGGLTQAISDITSEHNNFKNGNDKTMPGWKGSVINMSLTTGDSEALRRAMKEAFDAGIPIAVAAGNNRQNTADVVPCKYTESSVCVASSDIDYKFSTIFNNNPKFGSNYGREVKMIAPGSEISSSYNTDDRKYAWLSGTSMASPVVAGAMAIFVSFENLDNDVNKVWDRLVKNQLVGIISDVPSDPPTANNFVNSGINSVLKNEHEPYYGALSIDHPPGDDSGSEVKAAEDEPQQGPTNWEENPDSGPGFETLGVSNSDPDAVVVVTEEYIGPVETEGPNPDADADVGFEGDISMDNSSPPADKLQCAPTDSNGPKLSRGNIEGKINTWCDSLNLGTISQDDTRKEEVSSFGSSTPGTKLTDLIFSANWVKDVVGEGCPERTRGTEPKHCKKAMYEVLDSCGGKDGMDSGSPRYGGSQQGDEQCVIWKIEIEDVGTQTKRGQIMD